MYREERLRLCPSVLTLALLPCTCLSSPSAVEHQEEVAGLVAVDAHVAATVASLHAAAAAAASGPGVGSKHAGNLKGDGAAAVAAQGVPLAAPPTAAASAAVDPQDVQPCGLDPTPTPEP